MQTEYNKANWIQWTTGILVVLLMIGGALYINGINNKVNSIKVPTASEIANQIVIPTASELDIPTAAEIAAEINVPDTEISIRNDKVAIAEDLVREELMTRDMRSEFADRISDQLPEADDIELSDIDSVVVKVFDTDVFYDLDEHDTDLADVDMRVKVYFDDFGDSQWAKFKVYCDVSGLDYEDDYDNAIVDHCHIGEMTSNSYDN